MTIYIEPLAKLVNELSKLPGIGARSAQRLAYHIIEQSDTDITALVEAIASAHDEICFCQVCQGLSDGPTCSICSDDSRDHGVICVVAGTRDIPAMERSGEFNGVYHVLHGVISPSDNVGPDDIRLRELLARLADDNVREVILATNPDITGEATAMYIARLIKPMGIKVTRIAHGIPVGAELEYTDEVTLARAMLGRREL